VRITLTIEDRIALDLEKVAQRSGKPFNVVVNETLRAGLAAGRYRVRAVSLGGAHWGVDLDKALSLADTLEDEELVNKMDQPK
jgi:hypothetical protein